ncbi:NAD-dependent epimerase/dehydratase family protein [Pseudenhygromyxa sp. WMMC2535]|uniref:NAD-dependent epimerase/dehydratase family protein n=1 Tax=Pseudenhygromyxa sp. WMMC2535 TaxID=2712867 RepID=UPI0015527933|nr:NAD-dependent epimerase/dehydratase family protein [Pseudenhygromyxa sp. WMMC2535]
MRILVTGAGGQVGADLIRTLLADGHEVHGSDLRGPPAGAELPADLPWHRLDVTEREAVVELVGELKPDKIFHLAAILSARGEVDPDLTYRVNQGGTYNVLEACRLAGVAQLIFTSTIAVFGPGLPETVGDDVALHPTTMYGVTKAAGEMLADYYAARFGLDVRGVRFPGLISASIPGGGSSDYVVFMYIDGVRKGSYTAFCRPDTRIPLMYMPDGIRALLELSKAPREQLRRCIYNIAAFSPTAEEIAADVAAALPRGADFGFEPDPKRQRILDSWPSALDDQNAREDWGWAPRYQLADMTRELLPQIEELLARRADALDYE